MEKPSEEKVDFDENKVEKTFNANLLTNYEVTLEFMKVIEGPGWLENQPQGITYKGSLEHTMNWLKTAKENDSAVLMLYGWGGGDRYAVHRDGSVVFLSGYSHKKALEQAKALNFPIGDY